MVHFAILIMLMAVLFVATYATFVGVCVVLVFELAEHVRLGERAVRNIGTAINVSGFLTAVYCSIKGSALLLMPPQFRPVSPCQSLQPVTRYTACALFATLSVTIDATFYTAAAQYFLGEARYVPAWRVVVLIVVFGIFAHMMTSPSMMPKSARRILALQAKCAEAFRRLSKADRSVLIGGLARPGSTMLTATGSANHLLWQELGQLGWTRQVELPDALAADALQGLFTAWTVTNLGSVKLPMMIAYAMEPHR
jgi:hypothetical protein